MNFRRSRTRSRRNSMNIIVTTEKWRTYGKRVSLRRDEDLNEDSEDEMPRASELKDWVDEFFVRKSTLSNQSDQDVEVNLTKKQTLVLATLVPDEILLMENFQTVETKRFVGVLLMADVSGYTALSERYNNTGKGGTYRLTVTLNTYLGSLIEVIYSHGGDIIKFAGDAFLALWKTDKRTFLCHTIHTAIACALIIQHSFGSYETDVKVNLKVKLAISAGNLIFSPIGSGIDMNYIITGLPVIEAKIAESLCDSGEVKLTPTAWGHCYSRNYDHVISDDGHVTIKAILYDPREKDVSKPFLGFATMIRQINKPLVALANLPDFLLYDSAELSATDMSKKNELLSLRRTILSAEEKNIGTEIRKFMIRPVLTQIDAHQPLEYLTEMRQVSILFITLKPKECPFPQLITIVNNSYQITSDIVYKSMGCVNKIILFDKDVMILVIFGLRGFKHESEAQAALKCAYSIKKSVSALDGVLEVSIGVTSGQVYCGVVGHPLRREFTVIGAIVNKAARFMCNFRNKITCDEATYIKSKMSSNGFTLQPPTELKGIIQPGKIYEYTEEIRIKELFSISLMPPLLNRCDEMEYFENWLDDFHLSYRDFDAFLLIGENRIGKTRLLKWMARYARNKNFKVCYLSLTSIHSATPYLALSQIIDQIMDIKEPIVGFEKEEKIVQLLHRYSEDLCYLNNIIKVRFAYHEDAYSQNEEIRKVKAKRIFKKLLLSVPDTHVIFLDDLQNLDASSWEFLTIIFEIMKIFTVLTVTRGKFSSEYSWLYAVFIEHNIRKIHLGSLHSDWIAPLACQILDVEAVPNDLCNALKAKCNGMPGLVENFIVHLFSSGALELKKILKSQLNDWLDEDLQFPDSTFLRPTALNANEQSTLDELIEENATEEISICLVTNKNELQTDLNMQNVDALIMIQIDSLTPYQQLLLKIASVIGNVLSRQLLEYIMYDNNPLTTAKAIKRLFAMRILSCANIKRITSSGTIMSNYSGGSNLTCECLFEYEPDTCDNLPKYAFCKVLKFRNKKSRKSIYELLPLNQKKQFHSRIVNYFENNKQKCPECGGTIMCVQSTTNLDKDLTSGKLKEEEEDDDLESVITNTDITQYIPTLEKQEAIDIRRSRSNAYSKRQIRTSAHETSVKSEIFYKSTPILKIKPNDDNDDINMRRRSTKRVTMSNMVFRNKSSEEISNPTIFDMLRDVTGANKISQWHDLGVVDSEDSEKANRNENEGKSLCIHIEKGVSQTNFNRCSCAELNIIIHEQLIYHTKEADLKTKMVQFLIQFSYLNILANNFDAAIPKLAEAENTCQEKHNSAITKFDRERFLGKIYSLKAAAFLMSGRLVAAKINIVRAAKIYHINLNKISDILQIKGLVTVINLKRKKHRIHNAHLKADSVFFLNVAAVLYSTLDDEQTSRIAAHRSIHLVQRVECNVIDVCDAFTIAIQMELDWGTPEATLDLEKLAINALRKIQRPKQAEELFAFGKIFMTIFRARLARGQLAASIRSGYRTLVVSRFLHAHNISMDIIPDLYYLLLSRCRIEEAVAVVKLLIQSNENQITLENETWYYALCIDLILDAGMQLESPNEISLYAEYSIYKGAAAGESRRRLVVGLWNYWLRADSERRAKRFETEALFWSNRHEEDGTLKTMISAMRLAEGMLESLARKMDDLRKVVDLMELRSLADRELTRLEKDARFSRVVYPRWILLKANSLDLSGRRSAAMALFNQALEEARRIHNRLEESLALAATSNFHCWIQNARSGNFSHWSVGVEQARTSWQELLYKITTDRQKP
ncbi:adenylate cyclase type 10-like isoform X1 [Maniola hyperantus]|uniref:adenylate cyclase type 10-like isoform X1 n=1 Tax=Aphantopus hyperantus TaxID=2795564 RepID=UPI00156A50C7|nr:adenylate cyclase type 10-like [Maniola hyperantus]